MIGVQSGVIWSYTSSDSISVFDNSNLLVQQYVFGMYHLYGNLILEITQRFLLWVNSINEHLLVNNDLHLSSQIPRRTKQG